MRRALLDTSFVIALARGEDVELADPPEEAAVSVVTLCGLHHGVLVATDAQRPGRLATLVFVERNFAALPVDAEIAPHYGRLVAASRRRRGARLATATSPGLTASTWCSSDRLRPTGPTPPAVR